MATTDEESIGRTLAEFCQFLDGRRFREWSELFTEDGEFGGSTQRKGRQTIYDMISTAELATKPELQRKHTVGNIVIHVDGDAASVESDLVMFDRTNDGPWTIRVGKYTDRMVRQDGRWLFANRQLEWIA